MRPRFAPPSREREGEKQSGGSGGSGGGSGREREGSKQDDTGRRGGGGWDDGGIVFVPGDPYPYSYPTRGREPGITFTRGGHVWEVPLSASRPAAMVRGLPGGAVRQPVRSPVWARLAFVAPPGELRWVTAESRKPRTVVKSDWGRIGQPTWSQDDKLLAFVSDRNGSDDIYIVGEKGGKPRAIAVHPASDHSPAFASDKNWIYFVSDREGQPALWRIHINGNPNTLTRMTGLPPGDVISVTSSRSMPSLVVCIQERKGPKQLWLYTPFARMEAMKISDGRGDDDQPALSPDGVRVAFRTVEKESSTIIVWDRRTRRAERLTDGPDDAYPSFW